MGVSLFSLGDCITVTYTQFWLYSMQGLTAGRLGGRQATDEASHGSVKIYF